MTPIIVRVENVSCRYLTAAGATVDALRGISFEIQQREYLTLVGHSGAGKSTLLSVIAGLIPASSGKVMFSERMTGRRVGYLFQRDAVFPWRTVEANLSYCDEISGVAKGVRRQRACELCQLVGLDPTLYLSKYPKELSGGELRRLSLGMALSLEPNLLLLDEPTSSLDWLSRRQVQAVIQRLVSDGGSTTVSVTHDVEEALWLSDRVLVISRGKITASLPVELPRPRTDDMRTSAEFKALEDKIAAAMEYAAARVEEVCAC